MSVLMFKNVTLKHFIVVHQNFWLGIYPTFDFMLVFGIFEQRKEQVSRTVLLLLYVLKVNTILVRERTSVICKLFGKVFNLFWLAPKRHTCLRIHKNPQITFPKTVKFEWNLMNSWEKMNYCLANGWFLRDSNDFK